MRIPNTYSGFIQFKKLPYVVNYTELEINKNYHISPIDTSVKGGRKGLIKYQIRLPNTTIKTTPLEEVTQAHLRQLYDTGYVVAVSDLTEITTKQ